MFKGSMVALVTPMLPNGSIDKKSFHELIEWHIASKTDGLIITGTTGESPTITMNEQYELIHEAVQVASKRIPIIAGTGSNSTMHTLELTELAKRAHADAVLIVTPYYNKPPQEGLYEHYKLIADIAKLPIILYNVPARTACDLLPETVERLSKIPSIIGIKEATGKAERAIEILKRCAKDFRVFCGDDSANFDLMSNGASGVISVTANVEPVKMHQFCEAALSSNKTLTEKLHQALLPLHKALFLEANPIPVKWALHEMGKIQNGIRLPLLPLNEKYRGELKKVLQQVINEKIL